MKNKFRKTTFLLVTSLLILAAGYLLPEPRIIPVEGASSKDWNPQSFWYHPWGRSGVHKGIDIFAPRGRDVRSATYGIVLFAGRIEQGGNIVLAIGPKWRLHYYAHLDRIDVAPLSALSVGETIGAVGDTGNAKGKPAHLHYSIRRLVPNVFAIERGPQGIRRMWFVNPDHFLR
jgi:peptidoglycan LD-endopeptidase LytH